MADPFGLDVDPRWGVSRDAIARGDWRNIQSLNGFAERKFEDLQRLYQLQDQFNWYQRAGWGQYSSQVLSGISERESDLNRILDEGPLPIIAAEQAQAKALRRAGVTHLPQVAMAAVSLGPKGTTTDLNVPDAPTVANMGPKGVMKPSPGTNTSGTLEELDELAKEMERLRRAAGGVPEEEMAGAGIVGMASRARPPLPPGVGGTAEFGRLMQWGRGSEVARARITTLTREELQRIGVTRSMAEAWRDFYRLVLVENPANPSAAGRIDLMEKAVDLLK